MIPELTHSTDWLLEKLTRKGDTLLAYLLDKQQEGGIARRFLIKFCYVVSFQAVREECVGLECYDHEHHILKELTQSSYLLLVDEIGSIGYKHFRLQAANYTIDVISDTLPKVQLLEA
jgi:hypothetical protein